MKGRERHLPESRLQTSPKQTDHDESGWSFQSTLWLSSAVEVELMKVTVLVESSHFIYFYRDLSALAMSTYISQAGVALFPSF